MSTVRRQRRDGPPLTWELPAAVTLVWVAVVAVLLPAGRGAASWVCGRGWVWPRTGAGLSASLPGLLSGHPGAGLAAPAASALPGAGVVYVVVVAAEVAWLVASLLAVRTWWRTWGPGVRAGLADRGEVEAVLGLSRIRRNAALIRPDLYGKAPARPGPS
jgi:type IV secretion system protein VirD4